MQPNEFLELGGIDGSDRGRPEVNFIYFAVSILVRPAHHGVLKEQRLLSIPNSDNSSRHLEICNTLPSVTWIFPPVSFTITLGDAYYFPHFIEEENKLREGK